MLFAIEKYKVPGCFQIKKKVSKKSPTILGVSKCLEATNLVKWHKNWYESTWQWYKQYTIAYLSKVFLWRPGLFWAILATFVEIWTLFCLSFLLILKGKPSWQ